MIPDSSSVQQAIENARQALQRGDRQAARRWAEQAVQWAPKAEEPWLLLAAVSPPRVAVACLEQALQINPRSERARRGMEWALAQVRKEETSSGDTQPGRAQKAASRPVPPSSPPRPESAASAVPTRPPPRAAPPPSPPQKSGRPAALWLLLLITILCAVALWAFLPGNAVPVLALLLDEPRPTPTLPGAPVEIEKPTVTASPTWTAVPSVPFTSTPTLFPTPTATEIPLPSAPLLATPTFPLAPVFSATPTPLTFSETPVPVFSETPTPAGLAPGQEEFTATPAVAGLVYVTPDTPAPPSFSYNPTGGERWIDIDLSQQRLYAYEGDTLIASFVVSTGTAQYPTVTGRFRIYVKYVSANMSGPGYYLPNVPYTMYFYQGYGIHGTYWHNNFGTPMSHGCVNMRTSDAAWLFEWASVGTPVVVHP
jgi:lipoprotein-anchoring transpeptidase ErfK/SrfK